MCAVAGTSRTVYASFIMWYMGKWANEQMTTACTGHRDGPARGTRRSVPFHDHTYGRSIRTPQNCARLRAPLRAQRLPLSARTLLRPTYTAAYQQHGTSAAPYACSAATKPGLHDGIEKALPLLGASDRPIKPTSHRLQSHNLKESLLTYLPSSDPCLAVTADKPPHSSRTCTPLLVPSTWLALLTTWTYPGSR